MKLLYLEERPQETIRAVVINNDWDSIAPLFIGFSRQGVDVIQAYMHQRDVISDLEVGKFLKADVILTETSLPQSSPEFQGSINITPLVNRLRQEGIDAPIIAVSTFAFSHGFQGRVDDIRLKREGITVDRGRFRIPLTSKRLAEGIKEVLSSQKK